jgi:protein TonB
MQWALCVSVGVHAILLSIRFIDPEGFNRIFQDTPLDVILVNARSPDRPFKAQAIAQYSLAGGGEADAGRMTTPLPPSLVLNPGDAVQDAQRKIATLQERQALLLSELKAELAAMPPLETGQAEPNPQAKAQEERRRQTINLLGEIERRMQQENARPRRHYFSASTQAAAYALYYDAMRQRIEAKGTENFPAAGGRKLYGELIMIITVNHDGQVLATEIGRSSGNRQLDRRAQAIARSAGPFGEFNAAMRKEFDQYAVVASFRFTRDEEFEMRLAKP